MTHITRHIIALTLTILILVLSLSGCNKSSDEETTEDTTVTITFPEGITILEMAELLEQNSVCDSTEFLTACKTIPEGYDRLFTGVSADGKLFVLEGYLFPDTYEFYYGENVTSVISRFLDQTNKKITDEDLATVNSLGLTLDEALTLASVIQAEASLSSEMPKVSSVFWNRLNSSEFPYLGSDVTRHYIENECKTYIEENSLDYDTLFGNYCTNDAYDNKTQGLPVGPICNPGYEAFSAALNPADTDYTYFFTDTDMGYHYYDNLSDFQTAWWYLQNKGSIPEEYQ